MQQSDYEKPSRRRQWQERSGRSMTLRTMSDQEIEELRMNLVASYDCDSRDITVGCQPIQDESDENRNICVWLIYYLNCVFRGKVQKREIFKIKQLVPIELRQKAEQMRLRITGTTTPDAPNNITSRPKVQRPNIRKPAMS